MSLEILHKTNHEENAVCIVYIKVKRVLNIQEGGGGAYLILSKNLFFFFSFFF